MDDDSDQSLLGIIRKLIKKKPHLHKGSDLTKEIHGLMNEGQAKGLISDEESDMVYGVLDLKDTNIHSIMIPRTEITSASTDLDLGSIIKLVSDCGHTRIPFYKENIDKLVGILHAKDLLKLWGKDPGSKIPIGILRKPYFVPEKQKASELLKELKAKKTHLAIVTDEYGGVAGIITIEDILEEIVGEIMDEHDKYRSLLTVIDDNSIVVDARLEIEKLEEHFGFRLPVGDFESVGGFIIHLLGKLPKKDEKIVFKDLEMKIMDAEERKIGKILITHHPSSISTKNEKNELGPR